MASGGKRLSRAQFVDAFKRIKLLAIDVDGVLTDDSIWFGPDGVEFKRFNISDGFFMVLAMRAGLELAIVSGRNSAATESRMRDLGVKHVLQGRRDKVDMVAPLLQQLQLSFDDVAFVGNEILDMSLAEKAGLSIAVGDACDELKEIVSFVTDKPGGKGAVREVLEGFFQSRQIDPRSLL